MEVKILKECGYEEAIYGLSLSYNVTDLKKMREVADNLAHKEGGHNKFLESIILWIEIDAPRYWWSQFDTYRIGVTKQSESTMHTLMKRELDHNDFEDLLSLPVIDTVTLLIRYKEFELAKAHLPESFLQRRIICTSYKSLRVMIQQRRTHKLKQWHYFIEEIYKQIQYKQFLPTETLELPPSASQCNIPCSS